MPYTLIAAAEWPEALMREKSLLWAPDFQNEGGPPSLDGTRQFRSITGGGFWRSTFNGVQIRTAAHRKQWRALQVTLKGGMTPVDVPVCAERPRQTGGGMAVSIQAVSGWAARAVAGRVNLVDSTVIEPGMYFSDYDATTYGWRLHLIDSVTPVSGTQYDITFWPPARFAVSASHALEFEEPRCVMQLATSASMDLELEQRRFGDPQAEFTECGA
jgi:hypothetical protein